MSTPEFLNALHLVGGFAAGLTATTIYLIWRNE
jgi:hypothetical protein